MHESPGEQRATAFANAANAVVNLHLIDLTMDGELLSLAGYAEIIIRDEDPLPCWQLDNLGSQPDPDFTWSFNEKDVPEIVALASVQLSKHLERFPGGASPAVDL
jgi:hypothetical protein